MRAGELKQRIELQSPYRSLNSMNELIDTYTTKATIWAAIEPLTGNRLFMAQQANSEVQGICRIRYRTDVNPLMRIKYGNRYFQIKVIIDRDELNKELHLLYQEITI